MSQYDVLFKKILDGNKPISLNRLAGSSSAYLLSRLILEGPKRTYLFMGESGKEALRFQRDLEFYLGSFAKEEVAFFPPLDVLPFTNLSPHHDITCDRLKTLYRLAQTPPSFIATTATAMLPYLPPKDLLLYPLKIKAGEERDRDDFFKWLSERGYQNVPLVIDRGNFSVRGFIVDLFSPLHPYPLRIEWTGDLVESIREFDPQDQRTLASREEATVIPVRDVILNDETVEIFSKKIRQVAEKNDLPRPLWGPYLEKVRHKIPFSGIETYLPLFYEHPTTFWNWLPQETVLVAHDFKSLLPAIREHFEEIETLTHDKKTIMEPAEVRLTEKEWVSRVGFTEPNAFSFTVETHEDIRREIERNRKNLEPLAPLARRLNQWLSTDAVFLVASSKHQALRLRDLLKNYFPHEIPILEKEFTEIIPEPSRLHILIGELSSGFRLPDQKITIVTEEEIFGQKIRKKERGGVTGIGLSSFAELKIGDPIVHKEHGIGIYQGLTHLAIEGVENDFLIIEYAGEYAGGDKLYLPVYRMNLVQRYKGSEGGSPRIDKMGGTNWSKIRGKAEKYIRELAGELLNLYAARTAGVGFAFSPPNELFETFEATFPYEETPDQEQAISDVLQDMQKNKPMDRLVLGDVGYGKTEVALRAAFKAIIDGKQVVLLVPTTLLALQHYERFLERFRDYPVTVEMISRFRSTTEQKKIIGDTAAGKMDILIGTHRLLQPDVSFKDLGLLIIDEEHRFGVSHKEKIKKLRKNVDVLTLSATPIPRTFYMSLVGLRGISIIETPPTDRLAIRTFVMPFEEEIIREAILRELKRGGQVFFVHNEVQTIGKMKEHLHQLVPEATIEIGHGQMDEKDLEDVMIGFSHQKFNILLCTTIIESGIDIPTANTIIMNNADRFGLAQIYQLRGRVGRGNHRAYAYLLVPPEKSLTAEARRRLEILQRFSDLGSGYHIANYDLEIRGAGNLLGGEQSGQMTAIGYELYTELLDAAVRELKGQKVLDEIDTELHFRIPAFLPEDYIPDPPVRLELYRRLASLSEEPEVYEAEDEMRDRFGPLPLEVENLLELSAIKALAKKLRIKQIRYDGKHFVYAFDPSSPLPPELLTQRIKKDPKNCRLTPDLRWILKKEIPESEILGESKNFLRELVLHLD